MNNEKVKSAFFMVKQDIYFLRDEIIQLKKQINELKNLLKYPLNNQSITSTVRQINTTNPVTSTDNTTVRQEIEGLKCQNLGISIGNEGASTDRQTDTSTDNSTHNYLKKDSFLNNSSIESDIREASEIIDSLSNLKKEIRLKFKRITPQEMAVFSSIYQLEEQDPQETTYKQIAENLKLSESSIRDYVQRMINKGIPINKQKINNKKLLLSIPSSFRKIAPLHTIIRLREL